jgi:hypothetical protein
MTTLQHWCLAVLCALALDHASAQTKPATSPGPAKVTSAASSSSVTSTTTIGTIDLLSGTVTVTGLKGTPRGITTGSALEVGDTIKTDTESEVHATMSDGAYLAVRANSTIKIAAYTATGSARDRSWIDLVKGSLRTVTGWIAKTRPKAYRISTATATVGVRGTDHEVIFLSPEDAETPAEAGTHNVVYQGATTLETAKGKVNITFGQAAFIRPGEFIPQLYGKELPIFLVRARGAFDNDIVEHRNNQDSIMERTMQERGIMEEGQNFQDVLKRLGADGAIPGAGAGNTQQQNQQRQMQGVQSEIMKNVFGNPGNVNEPLSVPFSIPGASGSGGRSGSGGAMPTMPSGGGGMPSMPSMPSQ